MLALFLVQKEAAFFMFLDLMTFSGVRVIVEGTLPIAFAFLTSTRTNF